MNSEPLKYSMDFEVYLMRLFNAYAGMRSKLQDVGEGNYVVEYEQDPTALPLCNVQGALHIVNQLRKIMNRHVAMGNLEKDEIADMAGNFCKSTINPMFVFKQKFGITSMSLLENEGLNTFDSIYAYLTSIKGGQLMTFGKDITSVQYVQRPQTAVPATGIYA